MTELHSNQTVTTKFITTNDYLMSGGCLGCNTNITRHNSILQDGKRYCICCGFISPNGWLVTERRNLIR